MPSSTARAPPRRRRLSHDHRLADFIPMYTQIIIRWRLRANAPSAPCVTSSNSRWTHRPPLLAPRRARHRAVSGSPEHLVKCPLAQNAETYAVTGRPDARHMQRFLYSRAAQSLCRDRINVGSRVRGTRPAVPVRRLSVAWRACAFIVRGRKASPPHDPSPCIRQWKVDAHGLACSCFARPPHTAVISGRARRRCAAPRTLANSISAFQAHVSRSQGPPRDRDNCLRTATPPVSRGLCRGCHANTAALCVSELPCGCKWPDSATGRSRNADRRGPGRAGGYPHRPPPPRSLLALGSCRCRRRWARTRLHAEGLIHRARAHRARRAVQALDGGRHRRRTHRRVRSMTSRQQPARCDVMSRRCIATVLPR
ncbi:hypothetical protein FA95DRAFT_227874 [Auriscalpium vulgare]|uniref:Uncharacterized protein n=1 Tax=Auriscalpium vulgare TaxID=40419 RepID=A0ACB8RKB0_9AGAM|nr:hypothetical protein FA95DRAFT_227874 [Auriscalpium vulgare]